jgi:hypothetical protein
LWNEVHCSLYWAVLPSLHGSLNVPLNRLRKNEMHSVRYLSCFLHPVCLAVGRQRKLCLKISTSKTNSVFVSHSADTLCQPVG